MNSTSTHSIPIYPQRLAMIYALVVMQHKRYDPWGVHKDPITWDTDFSAGGSITARGYTMHEHLDDFGLINMNGRVYDPLLGRFLSPDNHIQSPGNPQNYNRYAYALNNPLVYTDPSGEFIFSAVLPGIGTIIDAACWGAVLGGGGYTASVAFSQGGFNNWNWGQFGSAVGMGAISGAATAGIGSAFGSVGNFAHESIRAVTHGAVNGLISEASGGDFLSGFAAGGLGSLGGSLFSQVGSFSNTVGGQIGFSSLSGGIGAELSGGDFWRGAATGAAIGLLNHGQHLIDQKLTKYVDEDGELLLDTEDGSDDVIVIPKDRIDEFTEYGAKYENNEGMQEYFDSKGFNDNMKTEFLGFSTVGEMKIALTNSSSQMSRQAFIQYLQNPTYSNWARYLLIEVGSQNFNILNHLPSPIKMPN